MATNPSDPIARIYASALLEIGRERGNIGKLYEGLRTVYAAWQDRGFRNFFTSPRVKSATKIQALDSALTGKVCEEVLNLVRVLVKRGREPIFDNIVDAFEKHRDEAENRAHAFVEAGSDFSEGEKNRLKEMLRASTGRAEIVLHYQHRPELLGGARIRVGDRLIDTTLRRRLEELARGLA